MDSFSGESSVLLIGKTGNLGRAVEEQFLSSEVKLRSLNKTEMNLLNPRSLKKYINIFKPNLIINAAAFTDVIKSETQYTNAKKINSDALVEIAKLCQITKTPLLHISSDYVFDGKRRKPYQEFHKRNPVNKYGLSKKLGEDNIKRNMKKYLIIRTSWLLGSHGRNFMTSILSQAKKGSDIHVVDDQIGTPTSIKYLAYAIFKITKKVIQDNKFNDWGTYHVAGFPETSWFCLAKKIADIAYDENLTQKKVNIYPRNTDLSVDMVPRPVYSALDSTKFEKTFDLKLESWELSIREIIRDIKNN